MADAGARPAAAAVILISPCLFQRLHKRHAQHCGCLRLIAMTTPPGRNLLARSELTRPMGHARLGRRVGGLLPQFPQSRPKLSSKDRDVSNATLNSSEHQLSAIHFNGFADHVTGCV